MARIGIVGLGVMGSATGRHLQAAGHEVHGFDTDRQRAQEFCGSAHASVANLASDVDLIVTWLPSPEALTGTVDGILASGATDLIVIEMGTLSLAVKHAARDRLAAVGIPMLDCPVSGTGQQAEDASLVIFGSGDAEIAEGLADTFAALGTWRYLGEFGSGSIMKFIANLLVTVNTLAAAEAHNLGAASGLDPSLVQEVISEGVGSSRMWDIRGAMMADAAYEPPAGRLDIIKKDSGLIAEHARSVGAATPALDLALELFSQASEAGLGSLDAAAIRLYLERNVPEVGA